MADTNIRGMAELTESITALNDRLREALPEITLEAARLVEAEIVTRAPVHTGALVHSLSVGTTGGSSAQNEAGAIVQVDTSAPGGHEHYAIFDEFGTSRQAARPFFRPGVAAAAGSVRKHMAERIADVIDKQA